MKYLIVGLGNIGSEYDNTRHNIGFDIADYLAHTQEITFVPDRYASKSSFRHKGRTFHIIKPSTYMNLSGKAVRYWKDKLSITEENILVIVDDVALPIGKIRLRPSGGDGGHNGLKSIIEALGTGGFPRLRIGIGEDFPKGRQVDYVLGRWSDEEWNEIAPKIEKAAEIILNFGTIGIARTMNRYNNL